MKRERLTPLAAVMLAVLVFMAVACGERSSSSRGGDEAPDPELQALLDRSDNALEDAGLNIPIADIADLADVADNQDFWPDTDELEATSDGNDPVEITNGAIADLEDVSEGLSGRAVFGASARSAVADDDDNLQRAIIHLKLARLYIINAVARIVNSPIRHYIAREVVAGSDQLAYKFKPLGETKGEDNPIFNLLPFEAYRAGVGGKLSHADYVKAVVEGSQTMMDVVYLIFGYYSEVSLKSANTESGVAYPVATSDSTKVIDFNAELRTMVATGETYMYENTMNVLIDNTFLDDATGQEYHNQTRMIGTMAKHNAIYHLNEVIELAIDMVRGENQTDKSDLEKTLEDVRDGQIEDTLSSMQVSMNEWSLSLYLDKNLDFRTTGIDPNVHYDSSELYGGYYK